MDSIRLLLSPRLLDTLSPAFRGQAVDEPRGCQSHPTFHSPDPSNRLPHSMMDMDLLSDTVSVSFA